MAETPEQAAAIQRVHALLQEVLPLWGDDGDDDELVVDWMVFATLEPIGGQAVDEDGDEVTQFFSLNSTGLSAHAYRGLIEKARDRDRKR